MQNTLPTRKREPVNARTPRARYANMPVMSLFLQCGVAEIGDRSGADFPPTAAVMNTCLRQLSSIQPGS